MKKAKRAKPKGSGEYMVQHYSVICPHCHTELIGIGPDFVTRIACWHCGNEIILEGRLDKG